MKRTLLIFLTLATVGAVVLSACGGQPSAETQEAPPTEAGTTGDVTADPNSVSAAVGPDGGAVSSIDGLVEFIVPENSVTEPITVNLTMLDSDDDDPRFLTPAYDIEVEGAPEQFGWLPMLSFPGAAGLENVESLVFATNLTIEGDFETEGDAPSDINYWVPLNYGVVVDGSSLLLPMWHFSPYRVFNMDIGPSCLPDEEMLEPPATPEDYDYVGLVVVINDVYSEQYSTLPPDYAETHNGKVLGFRFVDEAAGCDILVLHWYRPVGPTPTPDLGGGGWPPPGGGGWPPQPPPALRINPPEKPCWVYLGYRVYFRFSRIFSNIDWDKWLEEAEGFTFRFELSREQQPPGFDVIYLFAPKACDDGDECTDDWCNPATGECEHDEIPDCVPSECYCNENCTITSTGCTWSDANQCSGLHSACDHEGIMAPYKNGQTCCWDSCCITIQCP